MPEQAGGPSGDSAVPGEATEGGHAATDLAERPVGELSTLLGTAGPDQGAALLAGLIAEEDRLVLDNVMKPYQEKVPPVLAALSGDVVAAMLDRLPTVVIKRALFGNYTRIPDHRLRALLTAMEPEQAARLIDAMAVGIDSPREVARMLVSSDGPAPNRAVARAHPATLVRLMHELDPNDQVLLLRASGSDGTGAVVRLLAADANPVRRGWAAELAAALAPAHGETPSHVGGEPVRSRGGSGPAGGRVHSSELRAMLDRAPVSEAAEELRRVWPTVAARALRTMGAARAALVLERLAEDDAGLAAGLLDACNTRILLRPPEPGSEPEWWLHDCPAAAILSALDLGLPSSAALVTAVPQAQLELMLEHAPASVRSALDHYRQQEAGSHLRFPLEVMGVAKGRRQSRTLDGGLRWVHIEEDLDTGVSVKPVIIDLLEMELDRVRLVARMATDDETALPAARAAEVFEGYRATGRRPENRDFATLGLTQLSEAVKTAGALAAINGNFYFDYGHYLNGVTLGIDIANVPGLFFGDPIGWFVAEGTELIPPAFNRAAGVVTEDGDFHFERVFMTHVAFGNGQTVRWDTLNVAKTPGRTSAYTSLFGYRTQAGGSHVDLAIARGRIWTIAGQGDQVIPLTGFVLSIPVELATRVLAGVGPGDAVEVGNDFPAGRGRVAEAMACGPSLVRDGAVDLDFTDEDFGQQDSTVMSFFLPRTVETYEAARSFVARRGSTLILGTVSGTAYGFGRSTVSGGMTFGEMAQLCLDLGADHAYALDGGGSSSLVARDNGQVKVLNTPTGGADVVQGDERFINTYWLVFQR